MASGRPSGTGQDALSRASFGAIGDQEWLVDFTPATPGMVTTERNGVTLAESRNWNGRRLVLSTGVLSGEARIFYGLDNHWISNVRPD